MPGVVVGVGSVIPSSVEPARARQKFGLNNRFIVYVGRIDENKGCAELFDVFTRYLERSRVRSRVDLVLIGKGDAPIPEHPRIRHLGHVSDQDKFDVIAAAEALVMPSPYESLSMVVLEAWALGRPVVANAWCDVLLGQCLRSNAGLYYENARGFEAVLDRLLDDPSLGRALGEHGRSYYERTTAGRLSNASISTCSMSSGQRRMPAAWNPCHGALPGSARTSRRRSTSSTDCRPDLCSAEPEDWTGDEAGGDRRSAGDEVRLHHAPIRGRHRQGARSMRAASSLNRSANDTTVDVLTTCAREPRTWKNEYSRRGRPRAWRPRAPLCRQPGTRSRGLSTPLVAHGGDAARA